jgi:predicted TPR repeat methyltransferase
VTARLEPDYFRDLYRRADDPWSFETSEYERDKYRHTLAALGARRFDRALEVGCSIGVFTAMLAPRCEELIGVDVSERALEQARERLSGASGVWLELRDVAVEMPPGSFDLVVCSEVLYYFGHDLLLEMLGGLEAALRPGGSLLAVHWRPRTETYPLQGDEVHDLLASSLRGLEHAVSEMQERYRIDRFDRPA